MLEGKDYRSLYVVFPFAAGYFYPASSPSEEAPMAEKHTTNSDSMQCLTD